MPQPITLASPKEYLTIFDGHAEILFDSARTLTPEQAMAHPSAWRRMNSEDDIKFFTGYTYWIRFRVQARPEVVRALHGEAMIAIPFSYARHLDCYLPSTPAGNTPYSIQYSGLDVPADDRPVWWSGKTFRIPLDTTTRAIYLRCDGIVAVMTQGYIISEVELLDIISWLRSFSVATAAILLALFLYNALLYVIVRDGMYLYYLGYLTFFGGFIFFFESEFLFELPSCSRFVARTNPLAFLPFLHVGFAFTMLFTDTLLTLPRVAPRWSNVLRTLAVVQCVFVLVEWASVGADRYHTFPIIYPLANLSYLVNICCVVVAAVFALRRKVVVAWYYLFGWTVTFVAFIGNSLGVTNIFHFSFIYSTIIPRLGIVLEMIIFSVALAERIRVLQREKAEAGERERERIYRDLHDGLGAQIVEIAAMSEQLRDEVLALEADNTVPPQGVAWATAITANVHELRNGLRETIWVLNTENDTAEALVSYLRLETRRMLEAAQIETRYDIPFDIPKKSLPPETRRNIVMACREACTNIIKHSGASSVELSAQLDGKTLTLALRDNGRGFAADEVPRFSNGLKTMERRMALCNGSVRVESQAGVGTTVEFSVPIE